MRDAQNAVERIAFEELADHVNGAAILEQTDGFTDIGVFQPEAGLRFPAQLGHLVSV